MALSYTERQSQNGVENEYATTEKVKTADLTDISIDREYQSTDMNQSAYEGYQASYKTSYKTQSGNLRQFELTALSNGIRHQSKINFSSDPCPYTLDFSVADLGRLAIGGDNALNGCERNVTLEDGEGFTF